MESSGKRITPKRADADRASARRGRLVRIAAIAFAVLLVVAMAVGCAQYDGDQAAFCSELGEAPSFMQLAVELNSGTDQQAAATMQDAAEQFRGLERLAPRSIRHTVAALGDAAERIEADIASAGDVTEVVTIPNDDGSTTEIPIRTTASQARLGSFYEELQSHSGTATALYSLTSYGQDHCGLSADDFDLGFFGYGPSGSNPWGSGIGDGSGDGSGVVTPGSPVPGRSTDQNSDQGTVTVMPSPGSTPDQPVIGSPVPSVPGPGTEEIPPGNPEPGTDFVPPATAKP